jgi:aldehyde dehydrogenase (NAD+)
MVAKIVMAAAAKNLTPVILELGGKSPVFVDKSANIDVAATKLIFTKYFNNGQTCIAPDYVMVDASVHDQLVEAIKKQIAKNYKGDAAGSADYARIVNNRHWKRLMDVIERQKKTSGSKLEVGGSGKSETNFIEPTVFSGVKFADPCMEQELFGPVMPIIKINSIQEGLDYVNANEHPLAAYVFANNQKVIDLVRTNTHSGGFVANNCIAHFQNHKLPFGGVGNSGTGYYRELF